MPSTSTVAAWTSPLKPLNSRKRLKIWHRKIAGVKNSSGEFTRLFADLNRGRKEALQRLFPFDYKDRRLLAGRHLLKEHIGHTPQATVLVHETYLRLVGQDQADWHNRAQFFGVAAQRMRRILVD